MKTQKKAYLFAFLAIGCWSTIGSAFKITLRYTTPAGLLLLSSAIACIALFLILIFQRNFSLFQSLTLKQVLVSAFLGMLNPFLYYIVLLKAYDILPAQMAGTLNYIWPLVLVLLSVPLLKQNISRWSFFAILISFTGILLISFQPGKIDIFSNISNRLPGIFLAVGSALFWALYWIYSVKDEREPVSKLLLNFLFGFLYTLIYILLTDKFRFYDWRAFTGGIYIGLFEMGITFVLWLNALRFSVTTAKVSNLIYLSPFISLILIHFTVGETITLSTVTGLIMIVSGILLQKYLK